MNKMMAVTVLSILSAATALATSGEAAWELGLKSAAAEIRQFRLATSGMPKVLSGRIDLPAGERLRVYGDKGSIEIFPIAVGPITYEVRFEADKGAAPTQRDVDGSTAAFTRESGLLLKTGRQIELRVKLGIPATQPVQVQLETGELLIGRLTGKIEARVKTGRLVYDSRSLPADTCVSASVNAGEVTSAGSTNCPTGDRYLHVRIGAIEVK